MAEVISLASGALSLAAFAFQSSVSLYRVVTSFQSTKRIIRELKKELEQLDTVLESLKQAIADNSTRLAGLELPLLQCGKACQEFEAMLVKCTAHSNASRQSFRDWAKLQYMGDDIAGFKNMIAGYKATISIALGDATFRTAAVTATVLEEYKAMIANTTTDLEEHLERIEDRLQTLQSQGAKSSDEDVAEKNRIQEEKESTKQCLAICAQVSEHMKRVRPSMFEDLSAIPDTQQVIVDTARGPISAKKTTASALQECQERISSTTSDLKEHLRQMNEQLQLFSSASTTITNDGTGEQERTQEARESIKQCLAICAQASEQVDQVRTNVFEDTSAAEDSDQVIVATLGDLIAARRVAAGPRSRQWLGQMTDASLQQLSRDRGAQSSVLKKGAEVQGESSAKFADQWGEGHKLN